MSPQSCWARWRANTVGFRAHRCQGCPVFVTFGEPPAPVEAGPACRELPRVACAGRGRYTALRTVITGGISEMIERRSVHAQEPHGPRWVPPYRHGPGDGAQHSGTAGPPASRGATSELAG